MAGDETSGRGCIKATKGPWIVHRKTKKAGVVTKYRFPSDTERQKNTQRERNRRAVTQKIFEGLRAHGNYKLPKHADTNDLLRALCEEAGWHVLADGSILRKNIGRRSWNSMDMSSYRVFMEDGDAHRFVKAPANSAISIVVEERNDIDLNLSLTLPYS